MNRSVGTDHSPKNKMFNNISYLKKKKNNNISYMKKEWKKQTWVQLNNKLT